MCHQVSSLRTSFFYWCQADQGRHRIYTLFTRVAGQSKLAEYVESSIIFQTSSKRSWKAVICRVSLVLMCCFSSSILNMCVCICTAPNVRVNNERLRTGDRVPRTADCGVVCFSVSLLPLLSNSSEINTFLGIGGLYSDGLQPLSRRTFDVGDVAVELLLCSLLVVSLPRYPESHPVGNGLDTHFPNLFV